MAQSPDERRRRARANAAVAFMFDRQARVRKCVRRGDAQTQQRVKCVMRDKRGKPSRVTILSTRPFRVRACRDIVVRQQRVRWRLSETPRAARAQMPQPPMLIRLFIFFHEPDRFFYLKDVLRQQDERGERMPSRSVAMI